MQFYKPYNDGHCCWKNVINGIACTTLNIFPARRNFTCVPNLQYSPPFLGCIAPALKIKMNTHWGLPAQMTTRLGEKNWIPVAKSVVFGKWNKNMCPDRVVGHFTIRMPSQHKPPCASTWHYVISPDTKHEVHYIRWQPQVEGMEGSASLMTFDRSKESSHGNTIL